MSSPAPNSTRLAVLGGNDRQPHVRLYFERGTRHAGTGEDLVEWVKRAPRRHWDREQGCWVVTAFGGTGTKPRDPERVLRKAGFELLLDPPGLDPSLADIIGLNDLVDPMCRQSNVKPGVALVRPRFAGWDVCREILGLAAIWDKSTQRFEVPLSEVLRHGEPKPGLVIDPGTIAAARESLIVKPTFGSDKHDDETLIADAAALAYSTGLNLSDADKEQIDRLVEVVGDVPDWFSMDLYPYQRLGAIAACSGRNAIADPTGLGKTRQALAALAIRDVDRAVLIVPPVVLTNWARETEQSGIAVPAPAKPRGRKKADAPQEDHLAPPSTSTRGASGVTIVADGTDGIHPGERGLQKGPRHIVVFRAGRKEPDLPDRGVVIVPDSLIVSRPELRERIARWDPDALVYDEAHRARNWKSNRAQAVRDLCDRMRRDALRLPMTATPLFSNPAELASILAISGHLDRVFGGYSAFVSRYCKRNHFNALVPNMAMLPELRQILADQVWVRRDKTEVLKDLPKVSISATYVDVELAGFRNAHQEVIDKILDWLDEFVDEHGVYPDDEIVKAFSRTQIGLMSPLRKAAGLAKVPVALDYIADWIADEVSVNADGTVYCERPLLVWAHHQEVVEAMARHASSHLKETVRGLVGVIDGGTSADRRGQLVDQFQAGQLPVLVCSITAAGVGITLTKGSDQYFCETDYSPPIVSQAIDRQNRIGQTKPVGVIFAIAEGTLDARIHEILQRKGEIINTVLGDDGADISPVDPSALDGGAAPAEIIADLVLVAIDRHKTAARKRAA